MTVKRAFATPTLSMRSRSETRTIADTACFVGLLAVLMFGPLWFGAVTPTPVFILRAAAAVLVVLWAAAQVRRGELQLRLSPTLAPALAFAVVVAIQLLGGVTAYAQTTKEHGLDMVTAVLLMFIATQLVRDDRRALHFGWAMLAFAGLLALFAEVQYISGTSNVYWRIASRYPTWIFGPYFNHNHFAGLMEMMMPIALVWSTARWVEFEKRLLAAVALILIVSSVFLSASRAGILTVVAQLLTFGVVYSRHRSWRHIFATSALTLVLIAGLGAYLGNRYTWTRVGTLFSPTGRELDLKGRLGVVGESWPAIKAKPLLGWGLGTFPIVFPQYQRAQTDIFLNEAHNDYLQILFETGVLGLAAALWFLVLLFQGGSRVVRLWNSTPLDGLRWAAWLGCAGIAFHSLVDFNLHIPANAAVFAVLAGIVAASDRSALQHDVRGPA